MAERENDTIGSTLQAPHRLTRRSFIAGVGAMGALSVLGGLGLAGCSPQGEGASNGGSEGAAEGESYDVVIIGTGGAGMSAAIAAYDKGLTNVVLLEKMGVNGGNTNYSSSGMNASETKFQKEQGIEDSNDLFAKETLDGGHNTGDEQLVKFMCDNSAGAIDWLDSLGIKLDNITLTGGMSVKRCHRPTDGSAVGLTMVPGLLAAVEERKIPVMMNCEAKELIKDGDAVTGVKVKADGKEKVLGAKAVILATGGLGANPDMVVQYRPDL
ncbi:FAD-dependent oxidoreductase, partial [Eggerthella sinensis]|uniref:FAD-dependent oxidoreductase n=1 Tax=Eggerthella sinensis TaxID=242230 RepID=UPI00248D5DC6